ncbi:MAG: flagellar hook-associated protein FlgK [Synergistaceae bacterium]|nr:flagellar hook-associated protein FlgK [Synergistaceae bacterium]
MSSTFGGLEMGRSALNAFRLGMQTVGHNISNMGTEGYSRQRVNFKTVTPEDIPHTGQLGQGMYASDIERIRDEFLDFQFRDMQSTLGYWEKVNDLYDAVQSYIPEPTSSGIRSAMDVFFTNMQNLQQTPEDTSARQALVTSANSLGMMMDNLVDNFRTYNERVNLEIKQSVDEANMMLHNLAHLNYRIASAEALDQTPNDLMDQRDLLIDKLSKMMDISYNEPVEKYDVKGEFFLSVNGRVLVQGTHVRELVAHSFMWDNQVYYDVQVSDNEFDIVSNPAVADALATGPEGTYQLVVDRVANGAEWTAGGGNAHCLETFAVRTSAFDSNKFILDGNSADIPYKLQFRTLDDSGLPHILTIKIDAGHTDPNDSSSPINDWKMRAEFDGVDTGITGQAGNDTLSITELMNFIDSSKGTMNLDVEEVQVTSSPDTYALMFTAEDESPLEITDYSGLLGTLSEAKRELTPVNMRVDPTNVEDALNLSGSFRIQVGTQGTRVTSSNFKETPSKGLGEGEILGQGEAGDKYTFRVGVSADQVDFTASWNNSLGKWVLSSDLTTETKIVDSASSLYAGQHVLTVKDLTEFMASTLAKAGSSDNPALANTSVVSGKSTSGTVTQFYIDSDDNHLISISDVEGDLASRLGIVNKNPVITIDVESSDSLITIRNKINEKYQEEFGLTEPEQWVHASVEKGYLEISADVAGEAQRITLMGSADGNMQVLRRLGLTKNQQIATDMTDSSGNTIYSYREVAYIPDFGVAQDASFSLNNVRYLSSDNKFNKARRIPATTGDSRERYSAKTLSEVSEGMWLNLKDAGSTTITVRHHIRDGSIKAMEEIRDGMIPGMIDDIDSMAYGLVQHVNAYQYSGYGVGGDVTTTGTAFFNQLGTKSGAARKLSVDARVEADPSLIGAAMGKKDSEGKATQGVSGGNGDGTNASRMVDLNFSKILENHTMTVGGIYDAMLTRIGTAAANAQLMYTTEATVSDQIDSQRQAVSGVNLDEELMDMVILNRAFGAMSRYITTYDEMLDKIINGMGLVGR